MSRIVFILTEDKEFLLPVCAELSPLVEPCEKGIFLDFEASPGLREFLDFKFRNKQFISSIGIASSKLVARACAFAVQDGSIINVSEVPEGEEANFLAPLPVDFLWSLPEKILFKLKVLGFKSIGEAAKIPKKELILRFGSWGRWIYAYCRGEDKSPVKPVYPYEVLYFEKKLTGLYKEEALHKVFAEAAGELAMRLKLRNKGMQWVKLKFTDVCGENYNSSYFGVYPVSSTEAVKSAVINAARKIDFNSPLIEVKIEVGGLEELRLVQADFWDKDRRNLDKIITSLQDKFSKRVLKYGSEISVSRREKMLFFWDPVRKNGRSRYLSP